MAADHAKSNDRANKVNRKPKGVVHGDPYGVPLTKGAEMPILSRGTKMRTTLQLFRPTPEVFALADSWRKDMANIHARLATALNPRHGSWRVGAHPVARQSREFDAPVSGGLAGAQWLKGD